MATIDTVVPNSLNYTDIKPQAIENTITLIKYQPQTAVNGAKGGDMVKFLLSGNGFLDPYSTYLQFTVETTLAANEVKTLDRSAHSFIQRMVIRSQGVELERIENYDVVAAMINDMIYSPEQAVLHHWEGFPTHKVQSTIMTPDGQNYLFNGSRPYVGQRELLFNSFYQGASPSEYSLFGETAFNNVSEITNAAKNDTDAKGAFDRPGANDVTRFAELGSPAGGNDQFVAGTEAAKTYTPFSFAYHESGRRVPVSTTKLADTSLAVQTSTKMQFCIPIYSGILGLLMPEKKLIPLNLLPLDIEITLNPHALYSNLNIADGGTRTYKITSFNLLTNLITFEQEIHRTLEASVADHGLFIYCNSFHAAPQQLISGTAVPSTSHIAMNLKSINSVHFLFMYNHFETSPCARKLHFVSHNIKSLYLMNGTTPIPQQPIEGEAGTSKEGSHLPYIVELYKAWNKMHDPTTDGAIHSHNWCGDQYNKQFDPIAIACTNHSDSMNTLMQFVNKQSLVGRSQYGISLEGEELGTDRTMITGRKSQYPFYIQLASSGKWSEKTSYMLTYLRADFIVYIRPDLQIVTLGK